MQRAAPPAACADRARRAGGRCRRTGSCAVRCPKRQRKAIGMMEIGLAGRVAECPIGFGAIGFFDDGGEGDSDRASRFEIDRRRDHKSPISFGHPEDRKSTRLNSSHSCAYRMPSSDLKKIKKK